MAEVKMPLEELRELERQRDDAQQELDITKKRLIEVEANKMIVQKTITTQSSSKLLELDRYNAKSVYGEIDRFLSGISCGRIRYQDTVKIAIPSDSSGNRFLTEGSTNSIETSYINFEDVQRELREEAESKVAQELGELRSKVQNNSKKYHEDITTLKTDHESTLQRIVSLHEDDTKKRDKKYKDLQEKYEALKEDKDMRTTEQKLNEEIKHLKEVIFQIRSKGFWEKVKELFK